MKIEDILPLPSASKRSFLPFILATKIIKNGVRVERDADYVLYQAGALIEKVSIFVYCIVLYDFFVGTSFLVDQQLLAENKTALMAAWGHVMGPFALIFSVLAYCRVRLPMDIKDEQIPIFAKKDVLKECSRRMWTQTAALMVIIGLIGFSVVVPFPFGPSNVFDKINIRSDVKVSLCLLTLWTFGIGLYASFALSCALQWEKAYRFYDEAKKDIETW